MATGPNGSTTNDFQDRQEGELGSYQSLSLELTDEEIARSIGNRVEGAERFWNEKMDLDKVRERNEKYWLNRSLDTSKLYDFQIPYKDNRIFTAIESLIPMAVSNPPQPICQPHADTDAANELADNLQEVLLSKYEDLYLKRKFQQVARHLLIGTRVAMLKCRWDDSVGILQPDGTRFGDIAVDVCRPQRVVLDQGASNVDDVPLIGEYLTATVEELCLKFPKKQADIYAELGITNGSGSNMLKRTGYMEVWFSYNDAQGKKREAVSWKVKSLVLGGMKNPNWNYNEMAKDSNGNDTYANFLEAPRKPYILFNFLNLGKYVLDDTSLTEQAATLQDVVDKRGRQIVENADQANSGTIFNSEMISQEDVASLTGDPNERLMVKGNVSDAASRLPQNILPPYVLEDKNDARAEIDNIFGTHDPIRGQSSGQRTLGQDVISQRSDISRISTLATSVEDGADRLYKYMTQMMKVFYDEPQMIKRTGPEGKTSFITFSSSSIQTGMTVRVKSGTVLPDDPMAKEQQTIQTVAILDPLSIAEGLNKHDPKEFAKRLVYYRMMPDKYMSEILGIDPQQGLDPSAAQEDSLLVVGQVVPPQQNPTQAHLATHEAFLRSAQFNELPQEIKTIVTDHISAEVNNIKKSLGQTVLEPIQDPNQQQPQDPSQQAPGGFEDLNATTQQPQPGEVAPSPTPQAGPTNNVPPKGVLNKVKSLFASQ